MSVRGNTHAELIRGFNNRGPGIDPLLSVVICTHDRCKLLRACLESVVSQKCDPWTFEVIVVDNASTDATKDVVLDFSRQTGRVRYVRKGQEGVSRARAAGAQAANGRYIAYLDDDVTAHPGWRAAVCQTFEQLPAARADKVVALGGPVEPVFGAGRPSWLSLDLEPLYTILELGDEIKPLPSGLNPVGANTAIRHEILKNYPWDEKLLMYEENDLFRRLRLASRDYIFLYVPAMRVSHFISAYRCRVEWILERYRAEGHYWLRIHRGFWARARLAILASLGLLRAGALLVFGSEQRRLFRRCMIKLQIGVLEGFLNVGGAQSVYPGRFNPPGSG